MKLLATIFLIFLSKLSLADWTYITKNKSGIEFYINYSNIKKINENLIFWHLQNRKNPDKWGSLSTAIKREVNCSSKKYKNIKFAYFFGKMGTILEKEVKSLSNDKFIPKDGSVNQVMIDSVCKTQLSQSKGNNFITSKNKIVLNDLCENNLSKISIKCIASKKIRNDLYVGQLRNNKRHGLGYYKFFNSKNKFFGTWNQGKTHGQGVWLFGNKDLYMGGNLNSKNNGIGYYRWANGDVFLGSWKNDLKNGPGVFISQNGAIKPGVWKDNEYISSLSNSSLKQKLIKLVCNQNINYSNWNKCIGYKTYKNGRYIGYFKNGKRNGRGIYRWNSNITFVGFWKNGLEDGSGFYEWPNEEIFIGNVKSGNRTGVGFYKWTDGDVYLGDWRNNKRTGQGTYIYTNGTKKTGIWQNNKFISESKNNNRNNNLKSIDKKLYHVGSGTGFSVSLDGHVVTNNHVIKGCQKIDIHTKENSYVSKLIANDEKNDLALLKIDFKPDFVFPIANESPQLMDEIYVAGFPFGQRISSSIKITKGIISSLTGFGNDYTRMQIDAAMQPGNSGGPVYNKYGNVYGVAVAKLDYKYSIKRLNTIPELTNFAIKASMLKSFLEASNIKIRSQVRSPLEKLGKNIQSGTFYISCMMTKSKYYQMRSKKVLFGEDKFK